MRPLQGLAILIALVCLAGAGPASGDALCSVNQSPCKEANLIPLKTEIKAVLKSGTEFHFTGKVHSVKCAASTMRALLTKTNPESPGSPFRTEVVEESFTSCVSPTAGKCQTFKVLSIPFPSEEHFANPKSAGDGWINVIDGNRAIEMECTVLACKWELKSSEALPAEDSFKGGSPVIEKLKMTYVRTAGNPFCGTTFIAEGERELSSPATAFWVR